jgi:hypothetical protein
MRKMAGDKNLEQDINKAETFEDLRALLENATERSGIVHRDPQTGQFIPVERPTAAPVVPAADADKKFTRTETIGGQEFEFEASSELALERAVGDALRVAEVVKENARPIVIAPPPERHQMTQAERDLEIANQTERDIAFRCGQLTIPEYLEKSRFLDKYLEERGLNIERVAQRDYQQSWADATNTFKTTAAGSDWPGGNKNTNLMGMKLIELGLTDADDKVAALRAAYEALKKDGMLHDGDVSP